MNNSKDSDLDTAFAEKELLEAARAALNEQSSLYIKDQADHLAKDLSHQYWSSSCLNYEDHLCDGFYEVHGDFPEAVLSAFDFPSLSALMTIAPKPNIRREVLLFNRQEDPALVQTIEDARNAVDQARSSPNIDNIAAYRALAQVVAGHLGGPQSSKTSIVERWAILINDMKLKYSSVVIPIGRMYIGTARHRAILFKYLADQLDLPARVVKGKFYADDENDARVIIYVDKREMVVDLTIRPGTVYPLEDKLSLRASFRDKHLALPEPVPENQELFVAASEAQQQQQPTQPQATENLSLEEAMQIAAAAALGAAPSPPLVSNGVPPPAPSSTEKHALPSPFINQHQFQTTDAPSNGATTAFDGQTEGTVSFNNGDIAPVRTSIPSPFESADVTFSTTFGVTRDSADLFKSSQYVGDVQPVRASLGIAGGSELFEMGPAALVSDASGQQYIVQPVRPSFDFSAANNSHHTPSSSLGYNNHSNTSDHHHDIAQWAAAHSLSTSMDKFSPLLSASDSFHSAAFAAASIAADNNGSSTTPIPMIRQSSGGPLRSGSIGQPSSYANTVDVGKLYLEGLQQHGSVRASVPIEYEQRQALLSREAAAELAARGNSLRTNSPPPPDAKPGSHSSGNKVPFPQPEMPHNAHQSLNVSPKHADDKSPFNVMAETSIPSVSSEQSDLSKPDTSPGASLRSTLKEDHFRMPGSHAKSTNDSSSLHHQSLSRLRQEMSAMGLSRDASYISTPSYDGMLGSDGDAWEIDPEELQLGPRIGIGSYGEVYRGQWRQTDVAIKILLDQEIDARVIDGFIKEVGIMKRLRHPNILQFIGACTHPPNLCIITEFMPRGSLFKLLHRSEVRQLDDKRKMKMALDIARGMNYLHTCRPPIIHRDLKSPNLLVDKDLTIKVCDFGLSRVRKSTIMSAKSQAGTPEWTAPEVLRSAACNEASDVYSFGVILWELLTEKEPWSDKTAMQVVGCVGFGHERLPIPDNIRPRLKDLLSRCFGDAKDRPSFSEIIPILKGQLMEIVSATQSSPNSSVGGVSSVSTGGIDVGVSTVNGNTKHSNER